MDPVRLENFDIRRIKEIAGFQGKDPENLSDAEVWGIISEALIHLLFAVKEKAKE